MSIASILLGRPLATDEQDQQKIGVFAGIPAMGLDGLTSSAYGPEAALTILLPLGAAGLFWIGPITLIILALLAMLYFSYRQTIAAYPANGGSYTVARENLGTWAGLLAAAALMIDYILNVAVGISAGVAALVSAAPSLHHYTLVLCLAVLAVITLVNLRGTTEAGLAFALPTYLFIGSLALVLIVGIVKVVGAHGHPAPATPPPPLAPATEAVGLWILLRAFASGCTAMTGVESVSNGVSAFRQPTVRNAQRTLTAIVATLGFFLLAIAFCAHAYGIGAMDQSKPGYQSVLSQLTGAVVGRGWIYYITLGSVLATLCLSANTSFVGFPRLSRMVAIDGFLPRAFTTVGRRLVYSSGILFLSVTSGALLAVFGGITDRLIPLFAVGAFLAFTLSQAGMVFHWRKQLREPGANGAGSSALGARGRLWINGIGAVATGAALVIILLAKFTEGAWIVVLAIPALLFLFRSIHHYYEHVSRQLCRTQPLSLSDNPPPVVLIPMRQWDRLTSKALRFALWLSQDLVAVHLHNLSGDAADEEERRLAEEWSRFIERPCKSANAAVPQLRIVQSPYRDFLEPLLEEIDRLKVQYPGRKIAVMAPEIVGLHWWQRLLHRRKAQRLRFALIHRGDHQVIVISVPWYVEG